jgi:hypothetical protein
MKTLARVCVLVEVRPVEEAEAVLVGRKVRRDPVEQDTDPVPVQVIDEVLEVRRRAVAAGRRVIARHLVAPGPVERVLHDRQELDVRETHRQRVVGEERSDLAIVQEPVPRLGRAPPRPQVHLVDRDRGVRPVPPRPVGHPLSVRPGEVELRDDGARAGRRLGGERVRIRLVHAVALEAGHDVVLVRRARDAGNESLPDARLPARLERFRSHVPAVPIPHDRDRPRVGSEDDKEDAGRPLERGRMRAELLVDPQVRSLVEEMQIIVG